MTAEHGLKTETVEPLDRGIELEVRTQLTPALVELFDVIAAAFREEDPEAVTEEMLDAIGLLIVDGPVPDDDAYTYRDREVWEHVLADYGVHVLVKYFVQLATPALENSERGGLLRRLKRFQ